MRRCDDTDIDLDSLLTADAEEFDNVKQDRITAIRSRKEAAAVGEYVRWLKESSEVSYNKPLIDSYLASR